MRHVKTFSPLVMAVAVLMSFAGAASATEITSSTGSTPTIHATMSTAIVIHGIGTASCQESTLSATLGEHIEGTPRGSVSSLSFSGCGSDHVTVLTNGTGTNGTGTLQVHTQITTIAHSGGPVTAITHGKNNNGTFTSNGTRITISFTRLGVSCLYETQNTKIADVIGGEHARLKIEAASLPRVSGDNAIFCGGAAILTGEYNVTHPTDFKIH